MAGRSGVYDEERVLGRMSAVMCSDNVSLPGMYGEKLPYEDASDEEE